MASNPYNYVSHMYLPVHCNCRFIHIRSGSDMIASNLRVYTYIYSKYLVCVKQGHSYLVFDPFQLIKLKGFNLSWHIHHTSYSG